MLYFSTRDPRKERGVTSAAAIKQGLAPDGGLYLPERIPAVGLDFINKISKADYVGRAVEILSLFLDDYSREELEECCRSAYSVSSFPDGAAPLKKINNGRYCLELWHGPTCAFKDMALQLLPYLLTTAAAKTAPGRTIVILVATSGDTGKAARDGFADV
jgi:threonine synthase